MKMSSTFFIGRKMCNAVLYSSDALVRNGVLLENSAYCEGKD